MSGLKCTMMGYKTQVEANQCRTQMETTTGRPYAVNVASGAAMAGLVMYQVESLPNCFKAYSTFDDLFGNYGKAQKCQKALERMTGLKHEVTLAHTGSFPFDDDFQVTPMSGAAPHGLSRLFGHFLNLPLGMVSL